jgi:hypothetical protein
MRMENKHAENAQNKDQLAKMAKQIKELAVPEAAWKNDPE